MDAAALTSLILGLLHDTTFQPGRQHMYKTIFTRFSQESDGLKVGKALEAFMYDPNNRSIVEKKLFSLLQTDRDFARTLRQIIQSGPRQSLTQEEEAVARRISLTNALGAGIQEIKQGKHATAEDFDFTIRPPGQP